MNTLSENWLTDDLTWDEGEKFATPFLPGVPVRVLECTPIQWDDKPRFMQKIWIGKSKHVAVLTIVHPDRVAQYCSDHAHECTCKEISRAWMAK